VSVPGVFTLIFRETIAIEGVTEMTIYRDTSLYSLDTLRAVCFFEPYHHPTCMQADSELLSETPSAPFTR